MDSPTKPTTILTLGDICRHCFIPAEVAGVDCSLISKRATDHLEEASCFSEAVEFLRHFAPRVHAKVCAIIYKPDPVLVKNFKFELPEKYVADSVTKVTLKVGAWSSGAVTYVSRKNIVRELLKFEDVSIEGNVHDGRFLRFDDHSFPLGDDGYPSVAMAEEILDVWAASGGNRHKLYVMTPQEEEFLPSLEQLLEYHRSFEDGSFTVSPVVTAAQGKTAVERELIAFRHHLVMELPWISLPVAFCNDNDAVLIEVTRQVQSDWSLLGYKGCAVHTNAAIQPLEVAEPCYTELDFFVSPALSACDLPDLVDDDSVPTESSSPPKLVIKPSPDANLPAIVRSRDPNYIWTMAREVMSPSPYPMSLTDIQHSICAMGIDVQRKGVRRALLTHRNFVSRMKGKWALLPEARFPSPTALKAESCAKCFPIKHRKGRTSADRSEAAVNLAEGFAHRQQFSDAAAGALAPALKRNVKPSVFGAPDKVRIVRDILACDVAVARLSHLCARNGGLVGVVLKWHLPDPCAVGPVLPVPAVLAVSVLDEAILFDLDNFGSDFPPVLRNFLTRSFVRKVLPSLEDVELLGTLFDNEVHDTVVLGHAANYACSTDVLLSVSEHILNATLPSTVGHVGPTKCLKWSEIASIAAEACLTWRIGGELIYRRVERSKCNECKCAHLVYRPHNYGGSTVHEVMYCHEHGTVHEGWYALPDPDARGPVRGRRHHVYSAETQRMHRAAIAFGCHREL